jgi:NADH:ubiquinone oxidoreductase subunit E
MLDVYVCVGSSCHLRGSDRVVACLQALLAAQGLEERVTLNGSFCLDNCSGGVSVKVGEELLGGIQPESAAQDLLPVILAHLAVERAEAGADA